VSQSISHTQRKTPRTEKAPKIAVAASAFMVPNSTAMKAWYVLKWFRISASKLSGLSEKSLFSAKPYSTPTKAAAENTIADKSSGNMAPTRQTSIKSLLHALAYTRK